MKDRKIVHWRDMESAPRDGAKIRLRLKDGFGEYQLKTSCMWKRGRWVNSKTFTPISSDAIGWQPVTRQGGYDED